MSTTENGKTATNNSLFIPLPSLARSDGDITLAFLSGNGVLSAEPIEDDWYGFTKPGPSYSYSPFTDGTTPYYLPQLAASPLGCIEQWQYCNLALPGESGCGPLASFVDSYYGAAPLFNTTSEAIQPEKRPLRDGVEARLDWVSNIWTSVLTVSHILQFLGATSLASQRSLYESFQYPSDHTGSLWHLDVNNWFATKLASLQTQFVETVLDPMHGAFSEDLVPPYGKTQTRLCNSQVSIPLHVAF